MVPTNINYGSTLIGFIVRGLSARYPLNVGEMGRSVTGKPYYISTGAGDRVFYNASHHANEWITTPLLLKFWKILQRPMFLAAISIIFRPGYF